LLQTGNIQSTASTSHNPPDRARKTLRQRRSKSSYNRDSIVLKITLNQRIPNLIAVIRFQLFHLFILILGIVTGHVSITELHFGMMKGSKIRFSCCCGEGKVLLPHEKDPPDSIKQLFKDKHFMENIRAYNQMFSMTSFGAHIDETVNDGRGPYRVATTKLKPQSLTMLDHFGSYNAVILQKK
jgi:hypothetical protein